MEMRYEPTRTVNRRSTPSDVPSFEVWSRESPEGRWWLRGWVCDLSAHTSAAFKPWSMLTLEAATQHGGRWGEKGVTKEDAVTRALGPWLLG